MSKIFGGVRNSAVASQPCPLGHITADKREIKDFPKLPSATSFIRKTLSEIVDFGHQVVSMLRRVGTGCRNVFSKLKTIQRHYISAGINIVRW